MLRLRCPACKHKIPLWWIALSITPFTITCPKCRSRMRVKGIFGKVFGVLSLFGIGAIFAVYHHVDSNGGRLGGDGFFVPLLLVVLYSLSAAFIACKYGYVVLAKNRYVRKDDDEL